MTASTPLAIALGYLLGSIPTGLWLGLWLRGIDIRQHGSRNIGATNTLRVLGKGLGALALLGDIAKGLIPVLIATQISPWGYAPLLCGIAAILGHTFPLFLLFKGGKGVATGAGVFLALCPLPTLSAVAVFATVVAITRMVSAGSIIATAALTILVYALPHNWTTYPTHAIPPGYTLPILVTAVALLVIIRHRTNIQRILKGQENRF